MKNRLVEPQQYICVDGDMLQVLRGQFILVKDYQILLKKYRKLVKLGHINGMFDSVKPAKKMKQEKIFGDD